MDELVWGALGVLGAGAVALHRRAKGTEEVRLEKEDQEEERQRLKSLQRKFFGAYFLALMGERKRKLAFFRQRNCCFKLLLSNCCRMFRSLLNIPLLPLPLFQATGSRAPTSTSCTHTTASQRARLLSCS